MWSFHLRLLEAFLYCLVTSFDHVARNPVFGVSDQVRHKPGCTTIEFSLRLELLDLGSRGMYYLCICSIRVAKTKTLISFAVTAKLICAFVFAFAKRRFSHDAAHLNVTMVSMFHWCPKFKDFEPCHEKTCKKAKEKISCPVTTKLISVFIFTT